MKKPFVAVILAVALTAVLYLGFTNKPPKVSVYDDLRHKLMDSLQLQDEALLSDEHNLLRNSDQNKKAELLKDLSSRWLKLGQPAIAADYLRQLADLFPSYDGYMIAGNLFLDQIATEQRDEIRTNIVYGARYCFDQAETQKPMDLDARIGKASVIVEGTTNPMEGVMMLREIDASNPGNEKVNLQLGRFSMMSGQYDKAVQRFTAVLEKDSLNLQSRFLLAQSYLGLNDTVKALQALEEAKSLADAPMKEQIQAQINNLK